MSFFPPLFRKTDLQSYNVQIFLFFIHIFRKSRQPGGRLAEVWMAHSRANTPAPRHTGLMALEGKLTFGHHSQNGSSCNNHPHKSSHMTVASLNILGLL